MTSAGIGIILAILVINYFGSEFGIGTSSSNTILFVAIGAVFTALVADIVYKKSYRNLEERYAEESQVISKQL